MTRSNAMGDRAPIALLTGLLSLALAALLGLSGPAIAAEGPPYTLGEGDVITINVFQRPDLTASARIGSSGTVFVPMAGQVQLAGLTIADAQSTISQILRKTGAVPQAQVDVQVTNFNSQLVSLFGAVNKPGRYVLDRPTSLTELIAQSGGLRIDSSQNATIIRGSGASSQQIVVDLRRILEKGDRAADLLVKGGDIVNVPAAPKVYMYGSVGHPGVYQLDGEMSVIQGLALAGGITPEGSDSRLEVQRRGPDGVMKAVKVELLDELQPEDILIVRKSIF